MIPFDLGHSGDMKLRILDLSGSQVRLLVNKWQEAGERKVFWDGRTDRGTPVPAGVYVYELMAPGFQTARRMVKLR
jgi:flagellar hook assembly protein FlgD